MAAERFMLGVLWKPLGIFMIAPTLLFAIYITYLNRSDKAELAHNLAVCFWISANSVWMIGEFYMKMLHDLLPLYSLL
jgi:hypothetical protein